ncbi:[FeFe] hydrogenase H-cluster radical SAM maturase HydE [Lachnospiraceae bacterium ZAX-1]
MENLVNKLIENQVLAFDEFVALLENREQAREDIKAKAQAITAENFKKEIYVRGLIEISNFCKNDCYYCGIGSSNKELDRYRLTKDEILSCCHSGYSLGFRTFVLQGGEDSFYTDERMTDIIHTIRVGFPDCAITISMGEKSYETYLKYFMAGANRYLLRHETANEEHYRKLHPENLSLSNRKECLFHLKEIGFQVGTGFMVGSPYQTLENLAEDLLFLKELEPEMVGIGPFIPHHRTRFANLPQNELELTLFLISVIRLMLPHALIPATTAVGTLDPKGRERAILAGANVLMPNLSPVKVRKKYELYDNKICTQEEAAECNVCLKNRVRGIGYEIVQNRGDHIRMQKEMGESRKQHISA